MGLKEKFLEAIEKESYSINSAICVVYEMDNDIERMKKHLKHDSFTDDEIKKAKYFIELSNTGKIAQMTINRIEAEVKYSNLREAFRLARKYEGQSKKDMLQFVGMYDLPRTALSNHGFDSIAEKYSGYLPFVKWYIERTLLKLRKRLQ